MKNMKNDTMILIFLLSSLLPDRVINLFKNKDSGILINDSH